MHNATVAEVEGTGEKVRKWVRCCICFHSGRMETLDSCEQEGNRKAISSLGFLGPDYRQQEPERS